MKKHLVIFILVSGYWLQASAQPSLRPRWSGNPFEHFVFVENLEQLNAEHQVMFSARTGGIDLKFYANGFGYYYVKPVLMTEKQRERIERKGPEKDPSASQPMSLGIEWLGADPNVRVVPEEKQTFYYTYGESRTGALKDVKAGCYKKIVYRNMYPGIDIEYILPEKGGVKYTLLVHPGADVSKVKMRYTGAKALRKDAGGNMIISTKFGDFTDHAPVSFYKDGQPVSSAFQLSGNTVSFKLQSTIQNQNSTIIIDPWTTNPNFTQNCAWDVNYDQAGNVYAHGSKAPFQLVKFNNAGVLQWTYNCPVVFGQYNGSSYCYGDFAVDEVTGTSYIVEGYFSSRILKVNGNGIQTGMYPGTIANVYCEYWRVEYNRCLNQIVIAGGGNTPINFNQTAMLDTTMASITPVNTLATNEVTHDMTFLSIDQFGPICYMMPCKSATYSSHDNVLLKLPIPALAPPAYSVPTGYGFVESNNFFLFQYYNVGCNGFNGMASGPRYVFTYDGAILKKWNKVTGAFIAQVNTGGGMYAASGLTTDDCGNVWAGVGNCSTGAGSIDMFDSSLTYVSSISVPNTPFDLKLGPGNKLYASGQTFVSEFNVSGIARQTTVNTSSTPSVGCSGCTGSASATALTSICNGSTMITSWTYSWSPGGQLTQTATNLCPGTYTVTAGTYCNTYTATVSVTGGGGFNLSDTTTSATCTKGGSASVTATGGAGPYTYSWNTGGQTTQTATGLSPQTYTCTVTDANGCTKTVTAAVGIIGGPTANAGVNVTIAQGGSTVLNGSGGGSYSWDPATGLSCTNCPNPTASPTVTTLYCVTVTDTNGCTDQACVTVIVETPCALNYEYEVPNAFSPNNDGVNDVFSLQGWEYCVDQFVLNIYDRWGEKVFESDDPAKTWDGTYRGKSVDPAVFTFYISATNKKNEAFIKKGNITLLR